MHVDPHSLKPRLVEPETPPYQTDVTLPGIEREYTQKHVGPFAPFRDEDAKIFRYYPFSLAPGIQVTFTSEIWPEHWVVGVMVQAGADLSLYLNNIATGIGIPLGSGGSAKLPATGQSITVLNNSGTLTTRGIVIATRGVDASISPGGA